MNAKPAPARKLTQQDDNADFLAAVDEGLADAKAGRVVPYEKVRRWLLSWGTDNELPPPKVPQGR
jgi:predicted transcriptional regulator